MVELLPLALVITVSPLSIIPGVLVLHAPHPRESSLAYLAGWLLGLAGLAERAAERPQKFARVEWNRLNLDGVEQHDKHFWQPLLTRMEVSWTLSTRQPRRRRP